MQKAQIPCHHINYNLQYRPANILWQQNENMPYNDAYNRKLHTSILPLHGEIQEKTRQIATRRQITQFIQSIYNISEEQTNPRRRPNSLNLRRRGPFTWMYKSIEIFHDIGRYYLSMFEEPSQPDKYQNPVQFQQTQEFNAPAPIIGKFK